MDFITELTRVGGSRVWLRVFRLLLAMALARQLPQIRAGLTAVGVRAEPQHRVHARDDVNAVVDRALLQASVGCHLFGLGGGGLNQLAARLVAPH